MANIAPTNSILRWVLTLASRSCSFLCLRAAPTPPSQPTPSLGDFTDTPTQRLQEQEAQVCGSIPPQTPLPHVQRLGESSAASLWPSSPSSSVPGRTELSPPDTQGEPGWSPRARVPASTQSCGEGSGRCSSPDDPVPVTPTEQALVEWSWHHPSSLSPFPKPAVTHPPFSPLQLLQPFLPWRQRSGAGQ